MNYDELYEKILREIKQKYNLIVVHSPHVKGGAYKCNRYDEPMIIMGSDWRGTKTGLFFLFHEFKHHIDCLNYKYPLFYNSERIVDISLIWRVEWEAIKFAIKQFKKLGLNTRLKEANKKWVRKNFLPKWVEHYK